MSDRPPELDALIGATDDAARGRAWEAFVQRFTPILLAAVRTIGRDRDQVMDAYAHVLEALRADAARRLTAYRADGRGAFTTWLTVVARRLAVDFHRQRFGRPRSDDPAVAAAHAARRRLAGMVGADVRAEDIPAPDYSNGPLVEADERHDALARALAALEPGDRLLVRLRFEDDTPVREIARLLGFPTVFHVYRRLDRVLALLRATLTRAGIDGVA